MKNFILCFVLAFIVSFMCGCADFDNTDVKIIDTDGNTYIIHDATIYIDEFGTTTHWTDDIIEIVSVQKHQTTKFLIKKEKIQEITLIIKRDKK